MGAWDIGSFDNDEAMDWVFQLQKATDFNILVESFETVIDQKGDSPDVTDCSIALCAAEVLACLLDNPASDVPDEVIEWIEDKPEPSSALIKTALIAINVILDDSELKDLWQEADEYQDWHDNVTSLVENLSEE